MAKYVETMSQEAKKRYAEKTAVIGGQDPYSIPASSWKSEPAGFPLLTYIDMVNYLVLGRNPCYSMQDFKNYKSLGSYDRFLSGWVRKVEVFKFDCVDTRPISYYVVRAKVNHSQQLSEAPVQPWFISTEDGAVVAAHCTCMAGLGETCSHVASTMFYVEAAVRMREKQTVTGVAAYWKLPSAKSQVEYAPIKKINFTSSNSLKKRLEREIENCNEPSGPDQAPRGQLNASYKASDGNFSKFLEEISKAKPAFLSVHPLFADGYIPRTVKNQFPSLLTELYDPNAETLLFEDLLLRCKLEADKITVTEDQVKAVEKETRDQTASKAWFSFRAGRITASKIKAAVSTPSEKPALSLIKAICYPQMMKFSTAATRWGIDNEEAARQEFIKLQSKKHDSLIVKKCGLFLSSESPYLGATPDGLVECSCNGCVPRCLEIKCPFKLRNDTLKDPPKDSFLQVTKEGLQLKRGHQYYHQVQAQMALTNTKVCDFFVWTTASSHLEQISFDREFWDQQKRRCKALFDDAILPELVGKYFSRLPGSYKIPDIVAEEHKY